MQEKPSRTTFRSRMAEMVNALRENIVAGHITSGDYLPSIHQLSKQYKLSINSVQKGLDQLAAESLIERIPRVGIRVTASVTYETILITLGYYPSLMEDADLAGLIAQFQQDHPRIQVQLVPLQYSDYYETTNFYLNNEIVDVITINQIHFQQFAERNVEVAELFEPLAAIQGMYPYLSPPFSVQHQLYVQPFIFSPVILCYNMEHFPQLKETDPTTESTWINFMNCIAGLEDEDESKLAFYFYPATYNRWPIFLLQSGVDFEEPIDAEQMIDKLVDSVQTCFDLIHRKKLLSKLLLSEDDVNVEYLFAQQQVSVIMTSYFNINRLKNASFPFAISPLPYIHVPKTLLLTIGLAINQHSKKKEAASTFVHYLTDYYAQLHIRKHTYSIPAIKQAAEWEGDELSHRPFNFGVYREISSTFALYSDLHLHSEQVEPLMNIMNMYWMGMENKETMIARLRALLLPA